MIGKTFGFTNGIIAMFALLVGLYATGVNKVGTIVAILALLITDPLSVKPYKKIMYFCMIFF